MTAPTLAEAVETMQHCVDRTLFDQCEHNATIALIRLAREVSAPSELTVEAVARIVAPSSWRVMDSYLADMQRKYRGENAGYDPAAFKHKESMALARAVLTAIANLEGK